MQLVVLECDTINNPEQVAKCSLELILGYLSDLAQSAVAIDLDPVPQTSSSD